MNMLFSILVLYSKPFLLPHIKKVDMIRVWDKKGRSFVVHSVDARELIQQGEHTDYDPKEGKPKFKNAGSLDKYPDDQDLMKLDKEGLIAFALEKFNVKLSVRFGEPRLINEIQNLQNEKKDLLVPKDPIKFAEDQDLDELVSDELVLYAKQFFKVDLDEELDESELRDEIQKLRDSE